MRKIGKRIYWTPRDIARELHVSRRYVKRVARWIYPREGRLEKLRPWYFNARQANLIKNYIDGGDRK